MDSDTHYLYILELSDDCYYVGHTGSLASRLWEHFMCPDEGGSSWTALHNPLRVLHCSPIRGNRFDFDEIERACTLKVAKWKGFEKVRGGPYCAALAKSLSAWKSNLVGVIPADPERFTPIPPSELRTILKVGRLEHIAKKREGMRKRGVLPTFLEVPHIEKEQVKLLGARWHGGERRWFIPKGLDHALFKPWLPENQEE